MINISAYYLVDYENVNIHGLTGCERTKKTDRIIIFFTQNANSLDMSAICRHGESKLEFREVAGGKQSADMHILSYLGYLIGKNINRKKDTEYVIISKDTDFDKVIKSWKDESGVKIRRSPQISGKAENIPQPATASSHSLNEKTKKNNEIMKCLSGSGMPVEIVSFVASTVVKNLGAQNSKQLVYRAIVAKYKQQKGLEIYSNIKKYI